MHNSIYVTIVDSMNNIKTGAQQFYKMTCALSEDSDKPEEIAQTDLNLRLARM